MLYVRIPHLPLRLQARAKPFSFACPVSSDSTRSTISFPQSRPRGAVLKIVHMHRRTAIVRTVEFRWWDGFHHIKVASRSNVRIDMDKSS